MAYLLWKNERAYIYAKDDKGKARCMEALGFIGAREAEARLNTWRADNASGPNFSDRSMESVWKQYQIHLVASDYADTTIRCTETCVYPFVRTMEKLRDLTPSRIQSWDYILQKWTYRKGTQGTLRPLTTESRAHKLRAISAFCGWLEESKLVKDSPFEVKIPEQRKDAGRALQGKQVLSLFKHWQTGSYNRTDDYAALSKLFFQIVFFGGTRLSETLGYDPEHTGATYENIDRENCILKLDKTKAGVAREVALPREIMESIPKGTGPIFYGKISERTLREHLATACKAAGIDGRFRIHDGRVSCATEWARKNRDPKSSMDQFGWKTEKMAMHYNKVATHERVAQAQNITYK